MSALINNTDTFQYGEKGHLEYGWSNDIQEKILQFSFQLTRTNDSVVKSLAEILDGLLCILKKNLYSGTNYEKELAKGHLLMLYKMIGHTRDIIDGKGECILSYMQIYTWHKYFPKLAEYALLTFVASSNEGEEIQYGSWKDIKYFCKYCKSCGDAINSKLIQYCVFLINSQLKTDYSNYISNSDEVSLAAKWVPREKSSFGWLYTVLATDFFPTFMLTAYNDEIYYKALLKCKTEYRKIISSLNKFIDTLQIKQCDNRWNSIEFNKVTSISLNKQKKAFLNIKNNGDARFPNRLDRIECATNFQEYIKSVVKSDREMKGKRIGMADFTKQALVILGQPNTSQIEIDLLNSQWKDNGSQTGLLGKMVAMVDVSSSMNGDPMHVAIALGIRIAENSVIGNRVMTFSSKPNWVNLSDCDGFISKVGLIMQAGWGMNTNFYSALDMILDAIIENKLPPEDVQDMVLVILSDMQMDSGDDCDMDNLYSIMDTKYARAGIRVHGAPYKPPHILFWNLRSTSGFPTLSNQSNASMMSGFSPALLNNFCNEGINALQVCTPWNMLQKILANKRYKILETKFNELIMMC